MHRLLSAVLRAAARLPLGVLHAVGSVLGWAMYGISPTYRRHLRENLARAGYTDAATRRAAIAAAGQMLAEIPAVWFSPPERIERLVTRVEGDAPAMAALGEGKAVLFLTPHMGCFEVAAQYAALRAPITVLYRPPKLAWLDPLMREGRVRDNVRLVPADLSGVRELFNAVRRGEAVGFLPDQVPGLGEGEWAELFGAPAYTMTLAAKLAQRDNVACFLAYAKRLPGGTGYEILVRRFPDALLNESPARRLNRAIESLVRECPAQYLWGYNRYKVPAGAEPPK